MFLIGNCIFGILIALWAKKLDRDCKSGKKVMKVGGKVPSNAAEV